jgi:F-type H+-transporting ATPase subunit delta
LKRSEISKRYAKAIFDIAREEGKSEEYFDELKGFNDILGQNASLKGFMVNPVFAKADKMNVLDQVADKAALSPIMRNFLRILIEKGRIGSLAEIQDWYQESLDRISGRVRVQVATAYKLSGDLEEKLRLKMEEVTGKKVEMNVESDQSLIGGIVVKVGDTLYDGSIRAQLNSIRELLREEI